MCSCSISQYSLNQQGQVIPKDNDCSDLSYIDDIGEDINVCYDFHPSSLVTEYFTHLPTDKWMGEHQVDALLIYSVGNTTHALDNTESSCDPHNTELSEFDPGEGEHNDICLALSANYLSLSSTMDEILASNTSVFMNNEIITCSML